MFQANEVAGAKVTWALARCVLASARVSVAGAEEIGMSERWEMSGTCNDNSYYLQMAALKMLYLSILQKLGRERLLSHLGGE